MNKLLGKHLCAAAALLLLWGAQAVRAEAIDGVWGLSFGDPCEKANQVMVEKNGAQLICQYEYAADYKEAFYKVDFWGREGHLLLRFSRKGLFLVRFAFIRERDLPESSEGADSVWLSSHYRELRAMLAKKYGDPAETIEQNNAPRGELWGDPSGQCISLFESRSLSRSDTVMSYEDMDRR